MSAPQTALFRYVVYKITFPNGKIYVGKDEGAPGHSLRYFGSWDNALVEKDFTKAELLDLTLRKQILFESDDKLEIPEKKVSSSEHCRATTLRSDTTKRTESALPNHHLHERWKPPSPTQ